MAMSMATVCLTTCTPSCFSSVWRAYQNPKTRPLVASYRNLLFYTCIFAEKVFTSFPQVLAHGSRVCLSYSGVLWLYEGSTISSLNRSGRYTVQFLQNKNPLGTLLTAIKTYYKFVDIVLIAGGAVVSLVALAGFPHWMVAFYLSMRVFATSSLVFSGMSRFTDLWVNQKLLGDEIVVDKEIWYEAQREENDNDSLEKKVMLAKDGVIRFVALQAIFIVSAANPGTALSAGLSWVNALYFVYCTHRQATPG